jgi:hypothetical protein
MRAATGICASAAARTVLMGLAVGWVGTGRTGAAPTPTTRPSPATRPAPVTRPPTTRPAKSPAKAAVDAAVDALRQECAANRKDGRALRETCDYFGGPGSAAAAAGVGVAAPDVDAVLSALVDPRLDPDPRAALYIRWQFLSALPAELPPTALPRALDAYRQAPRPAARFGLAEKDQRVLDELLSSVRKTDDVVLTSKLEAQARQGAEQNKPVLAYRDEWYRRLPKVPATFAAAFEDAYQRQSQAAGAETFSALVIADVQQWLVVGGDPAAAGALAELVARLRDKPAPPYYASAAVRSGKLTWVKKTDSMDPRKKLTHLHQALVEAAQKPPTPPPKPARK